MKNKDAELSGLSLISNSLTGGLDVLLQLLDSIFQCGAGVINLVDNENLLSNQILHAAQRTKVEPLGSGHTGARDLDFSRTVWLHAVGGQCFVQRKPDGLDWDIGAAGFLKECAQNPCGHVATPPDGDHELGLELGK